MYPSQYFRSLEQPPPAGFLYGEAVLGPMLSPTSYVHRSPDPYPLLPFASATSAGLASLDMATSAAELEIERFSSQRCHPESWGDSGMAEASPGSADTSAHVCADDRGHNQMFVGDRCGPLSALDSSVSTKESNDDQKALRRLAQNREAARKSRLRKKAYVQQLESYRSKLKHLEGELQHTHQQGVFVASGPVAEYTHASTGSGTTAFDIQYAHWLGDHHQKITNLRSALCSHVEEDELRLLVDLVMAHYDEIFRLKSAGSKSDVLHILSGMWTTPAERCFMWLGGFRSSELLKILVGHLEPLTDQQLMGICNLQLSSQQAEDALSQGLEALHQSLSDSISCASLSLSAGSDNFVAYMNQMTMAIGKLATLENFVRQADLLRQQMLQQMRRILTTRQAARALLAIHDYFSRVRALSSLWLARPRN